MSSQKQALSLAKTRRFTIILLVVSGILATLYVGTSMALALILAYLPPLPVTQTPSSLSLSYREVAFLSRGDRILLRGWFIPAILPDGQMSAERTIIVVHGVHANRATPLVLDLSATLARRGFAVLAFDMRGDGESSPAPLGGGYFEQRDVLGAVDFLRTGRLPYPELGRPRFIGGWGISQGGVALLFAAAQEPALQALVIDSAYASMESLIKHAFGAASVFLPATRLITSVLYGIDYYAVRPVDVVAKIAPRPLLFIHGADDTIVPPSNMEDLAGAARSAPQAHVQTWLVPHTEHIEAYVTAKQAYIERMLVFFTGAASVQTHARS
ncbi:MAG TPA: alpha/beta hydrolase [Ktedonobacteraceae bacterium]|nr:alpha/beta hydrolase [Ktedonobacteraceae bacterium]